MTWLKETKYTRVGKDSFKSCHELNSWSLLSASREAHDWTWTLGFFSLQETLASLQQCTHTCTEL